MVSTNLWDSSQLADVVNQQKLGSQRTKNEAMRKLGMEDPTQYANQYTQQAQTQSSTPNVQSTYQPTSLKDLYSQSHPTPPDTRPEYQKLFSGFGEDENPELLRRAGVQSDYDFITSTDPTRFNDTWKDKFHTAHLFDAFQSHDFGAPENPWQELVQNPGSDLANARAFGVYSPLAHQQDPYVKYLNSKYPGDGRTSNGWKIGDNLYYSPTKAKQGNLSDYYPNASGDMNGPGMFDTIQKDMPNAFNDDGTFNPAGWGVSKGKGGKAALSGLLNTISIIAPAFGGVGLGAAEAGLAPTATELAIDAGALGGANTGALGAASLGSAGTFGAGGVYGTGLNTGSSLVNSGIESFGKNLLTSGGDVKKAALSSLFGGASSGANSFLSNYLTPQIGEIGAKMVGGAASGGLNSLFNKGSPIGGSLYGAMSGGLHGFLNSTSSSGNQLDRGLDTQNKRLAQNLTKLAQLYGNRKT